ncbi:MAG: DNA repair protein RadA [uncultured Thermomicrobiales bacterium]|uniref:DNA repair protein RadA n=1 Tax=uncultured Thermomicrobiales bacterium TaxID=1645740 RepID=A0A6J4U8Y0_9BACT|nr:MAG: DNA repair protein RadA [uncultured Thermomicrobiales bacterium]
MAKVRTTWVCQQCGAISPGYLGKCPACGEWHSMVETIEERASTSRSTTRSGTAPLLQPLSEISPKGQERHIVPISELNRVLGGGLVPGSLVLIGGDPGIGKSTLILQAASMLGSQQQPVVYVSAEESPQQIKLRADRLGIRPDHVLILSETNLNAILGAIEALDPALLVIDSIQTVMLDEISSAAGSVSQVRECTSRLMQWAKPRNVPVFVIGHVTKEGAIAGPRVLEHMVDAVLYLEGERFHQYRILRAVKNRFGSTDEVGVFEMADVGLREVSNPSEAFLEERSDVAAGSTVAVTMEGTRPILVEVQALATATAFGLPRRSANGLDTSRLQLLVAVLQKRVGLGLGAQDVYANVVGGLRVMEPAVDLAVAIAVASSFRDRPVDRTSVVIGEIGLSGELRSVNQLDRRINEASRLGFSRMIVPQGATRGPVDGSPRIDIVRCGSAAEAIEAALT